MNIKIAIVDSDKNYLERLSGVMQQYDELTVSVFSRVDSFQQAIGVNDFHVVLFDPDISEQVFTFSAKTMPVCLFSEETKNLKKYPAMLSILKYQRISNIYKEIIKNYAEYAKDIGAEFFNADDAKVIAVYSPIGGSGKTTIALSLARKISRMHKKVLFLSVEQCNSSALYCKVQEEGITQLVESVNGSSNFELKLKGILKQKEEGFLYIEGFNRLVDYDAVRREEIEQIMHKIKTCGVCDFVIIDMGSTLDDMNKTVLEKADKIIFVQSGGDLADVKVSTFEKQVLMNDLRERMLVVRNFAAQNMRVYEIKQVPVIGTVHNYGNIMHSDLLNCIEHENNINLNVVLA